MKQTIWQSLDTNNLYTISGNHVTCDTNYLVIMWQRVFGNLVIQPIWQSLSRNHVVQTIQQSCDTKHKLSCNHTTYCNHVTQSIWESEATQKLWIFLCNYQTIFLHILILYLQAMNYLALNEHASVCHGTIQQWNMEHHHLSSNHVPGTWQNISGIPTSKKT